MKSYLYKAVREMIMPTMIACCAEINDRQRHILLDFVRRAFVADPTCLFAQFRVLCECGLKCACQEKFQLQGIAKVASSIALPQQYRVFTRLCSITVDKDSLTERAASADTEILLDVAVE